jgi:hypothetical protein
MKKVKISQKKTILLILLVLVVAPLSAKAGGIDSFFDIIETSLLVPIRNNKLILTSIVGVLAVVGLIIAYGTGQKENSGNSSTIGVVKTAVFVLICIEIFLFTV